MEKQELIEKIKNTTSAVDLYNLKEEILAYLEPTKKAGKSLKDKEVVENG